MKGIDVFSQCVSETEIEISLSILNRDIPTAILCAVKRGIQECLLQANINIQPTVQYILSELSWLRRQSEVSPCSTEHREMRPRGAMEVHPYAFLIWTLCGQIVVTLTPGPPWSREEPYGNNWIRKPGGYQNQFGCNDITRVCLPTHPSQFVLRSRIYINKNSRPLSRN
jgi:hypothetical protein